MEMHIALVCNPSRGNEKTLRMAHAIAMVLAQKQIAYSVFSEQWPKAFPGISDIWIVGGDGTLNHFINQYYDVALPLAVFPAGSGNDFHWMLYRNMPLEQQIESMLLTPPQKVDAGICNGRLFLNGVGIGFDGAVVYDLLDKKKLAGKASYLLSILKHIAGFTEKAATVHTPTAVLKKDIFMISVANTIRYGGGFYVAPKAKVDDSLLDVNIIGRIPPLKRVRYLPVMEKGQHLDLPFVSYLQAEGVQIQFDEPVHAHIDGEYLLASHFEIRVLPQRFSFRF